MIHLDIRFFFVDLRLAISSSKVEGELREPESPRTFEVKAGLSSMSTSVIPVFMLFMS